MADTICFAFGDGDDSYFYNGPQQWAWQNLPVDLQREFRNQQDKYIDVFDLAIGTKGSWYIGGRQKCLANGMIREKNAFSSDLPQKLGEWLVSRDTRTLRIVFGEWNSFFAWDKDGYLYDGVPVKLAARLEEFKQQGGLGSIMPKCVALVFGGSFFFLSQNLQLFCYDLTGCSPQLERELNMIYESHKAPWFEQIKHVSINSHQPGQYLIIDREGTAMGNYPISWDKACNPVHHNVKVFFNPLPSPQNKLSVPRKPLPPGISARYPQSSHQNQHFANMYTMPVQAQAYPVQQPRILSSSPPPYPGHEQLMTTIDQTLAHPSRSHSLSQPLHFEQHNPSAVRSSLLNLQPEQEKTSTTDKKQNRMSKLKKGIKSRWKTAPMPNGTNEDSESIFEGSITSENTSNNGAVPANSSDNNSVRHDWQSHSIRSSQSNVNLHEQGRVDQAYTGATIFEVPDTSPHSYTTSTT